MKKPVQVRLGGLFSFERTCLPQETAVRRGRRAFMRGDADDEERTAYLCVIPAKAGIHLASDEIKGMDSRLRGNDMQTGREV
ncbi:hypothetical protein [Desulfomicrobium escambiense]|uniref:hypothetical protein n=1 Tax=Desulfomicrobium escambiense TaxID=29503 RepID=UPI0012EB76B3|nr:hypothetical protein [Desulfomicrobium escambiense]